MDRRIIGLGFCLISSLLYASKFIAAAIFMSGLTNWSKSLYESGLYYVGNSLNTFSLIALIIGIIYLIWAEIDIRSKN